MSVHEEFKRKKQESLSAEVELMSYISAFFLKYDKGVYVRINDDYNIEIRYKPHRNECYGIQRDSFYELLNKLCEELNLKCIYKESRCWENLLIEAPRFHEETVILE